MKASWPKPPIPVRTTRRRSAATAAAVEGRGQIGPQHRAHGRDIGARDGVNHARRIRDAAGDGEECALQREARAKARPAIVPE